MNYRHSFFATIEKFYPAIIITAILAILFATPGANELLQYNRTLLQEQPWRIISANLVHWNGSQLFWDLLAFLITGAVCCSISKRTFYIITAISSLSASCSVVFFNPEIILYRGISGVDMALFSFDAIYLSVALFRKERALSIFGSIMFLLMMGKIAFECTTGKTVFADSSDFVSLPVSHMTGALVGALIFILFFLRPASETKSAACRLSPGTPGKTLKEIQTRS